MNRAQRRRFTAKLRAKYIMRSALPLFLAAALLVYGLSIALNSMVSVFLPRTVVFNIESRESLYSILRYMGLTALVDVVLSPLTMAYFWWLWQRSMLKNSTFREAAAMWLASIRGVIGAVGAKLMFYIIIAKDMLIFMAVPTAVIIYAGRVLPAAAMYLNSLGAILLVSGAVIAAVDILSYRTALYLYAASPERGIRTVFAESRAFMSGRRFEFLFIHITMLPWFAAEVLTSGIAMCYTRPYYDLTVMIYTQYAYKLWLVDTGRLSREQFEFPLPGLPEFDSGWLW